MRVNRFLAAAAALFIAVLPARADQILGPGRITSGTNKLVLPGGPTLGTYQNGQFTSQPYNIQIQGPGSTGEAGAFSVAFPSLATRTLLDRQLERPSVIDYGVDITGVADSTAALTAALNSGKRVTAPCGTIRLVSTVTVTTQALFDGPGDCLTLKYDAPAGSPGAPLLDIKATAVGSRFDNFAFDHQANTKGFTDPTVYGGNLIAGSAILVQADNTSLTRVTGRNGHNNCISVVQLPNSGPSWEAIPGKPVNYSLQTIRTSSCGQDQYKAGAGIDIGSGAHGTVNDHTDVGSYGAFILDIGAGAQGTFTNLTGIATAYSASRFALDGTRSQTFYIGGPGSTFTNLVSIDAGDRALWLDGFATRTVMSSVLLKTTAAEAAIIKSPQATISGLVIDSPGYLKTTGTVDAIILDTSAGALTGLNLINPVVKDTFNKARYGINQVGGNATTGYALGYDFSGAVTESNNLSGTFGLINGSALGGGWTSYTPTVTFTSGTATTMTVTGKYRKVGKTVEWKANVNLTSIGSADGAVMVTLPFAVSEITPFNGTEVVNTGVSVPGAAIDNSTTATFKRYDGTSPIANNNYLSFSGIYQTP